MIAVIEQEPTTALSLAAICRALQVNRAAYYRAHQQATSRDDIELRDAIQRIALEMPGYGSRRITAELRRRGWDDQSQARTALHAGRQSAVPAAGPTRAYDRFAARADGLFETWFPSSS